LGYDGKKDTSMPMHQGVSKGYIVTGFRIYTIVIKQTTEK
jgi:hypothetical protein